MGLERRKTSTAAHGRDKDEPLVQEVVTNLMAARIEVREDTHPDVVQHVHPRHVQMIVVPLSNGLIAEARSSLLHVLREVINRLISLKVICSAANREHAWTDQNCIGE